MHGILPRFGEPAHLRPLPGKRVPRDVASTEFLGPSGDVLPYSEHWEYMRSCNAIEVSALPKEGTSVMIRPAAGKQLGGIPQSGAVRPWSAEHQAALVRGDIEPPQLPNPEPSEPTPGEVP